MMNILISNPVNPETEKVPETLLQSANTAY